MFDGLFDAHSDIPSKVLIERSKGKTQVIKNEFLQKMKEGGINARLAAVYLEDEHIPEAAVRVSVEMLEAMHQDVEETEELEIATSIDELRKINENDKTGFLLGIEGAESIQNELRLVDLYYRLGVRLMTLTHSRRNHVATGAPTEIGASERKGVISEFGEKVVHRMNEIGMVVDISHLNKQGFWQVEEISEDLLTASHSNCQKLCNNPRNLTDEQLKAVADSGGAVGMVAGVDDFVSSGGASIDDYLDQMEHAVDVAGINHVGIGLDYWEYLKGYFDEELLEDIGVGIEKMSDDDEVANLIPAMRERGFSDKEIKKICRENMLNTFEKVID